MTALPRSPVWYGLSPVGDHCAIGRRAIVGSACHPAAVHHQVFTGDEARLVRRQEQRGAGDILRAAEPRQWRAAVAIVDPARLDRAAALAGEDFARRDGVADDVVSAVVGGDLAR